jgi:hypothetical protein
MLLLVTKLPLQPAPYPLGENDEKGLPQDGQVKAPKDSAPLFGASFKYQEFGGQVSPEELIMILKIVFTVQLKYDH